MKKTRSASTKDRRDIGEVVSPIEQMLAAREMSSCCVGTEALLESDAEAIRQRIGVTRSTPASRRRSR